MLWEVVLVAEQASETEQMEWICKAHVKANVRAASVDVSSLQIQSTETSFVLFKTVIISLRISALTPPPIDRFIYYLNDGEWISELDLFLYYF